MKKANKPVSIQQDNGSFKANRDRSWTLIYKGQWRDDPEETCLHAIDSSFNGGPGIWLAVKRPRWSVYLA